MDHPVVNLDIKVQYMTLLFSSLIYIILQPQVQNGNSNSNSANGGSVNSQVGFSIFYQ